MEHLEQEINAWEDNRELFAVMGEKLSVRVHSHLSEAGARW